MREGPLRIIIPGGSGQIGRLLARHFRRQNHSVTVLARHPQQSEWNVLLWDGRTLESWASVIDGADVVINLAGHTVNCRYNAHNRREILESRVHTTRLVGEAIAAASSPPAVWLNASTATIYRHSFDRAQDEGGELEARSRMRLKNGALAQTSPGPGSRHCGKHPRRTPEKSPCA